MRKEINPTNTPSQTQQFIKNIFRTTTAITFITTVETEPVECYIEDGKLVLL